MARAGRRIFGIGALLLAAAWSRSAADPPTPHFVSALDAHARAGNPAQFILVAGLAAYNPRSILEGPIAAEVVRVIDGDTITVRAQIWIGQEVTTNVRLAGVNAPELHGACLRERDMAEAARRFLAERLEGRTVRLRHVAIDKYGGRVVAKVEDEEGRDIAADLLAADLVVPYDGGPRQSWCG